MKNLKGFIAGVLTTVIFAAMINTVVAEQISKTITAVYRDIKITIDGNQIEPKDANGNIVEPFISDGTTYLPVRSVADAVGYDVAWDGDTNTVKLTKKAEAAEIPVSTGHSRTNPAPIGTAQTLTIDDYGDIYTVTINVEYVISGNEAWDLIYEANQFNDPPADDKIYIIANIKATVDKVNSEKAITLRGGDFDLFSDSNVEYESVSTVDPAPEFYGKVFEGGTLTGNAVFLVDKADPNPKIVYGMDYDGTGGIWFSLK